MEVDQKTIGFVLVALSVVAAGCVDNGGGNVEFEQTSGVVIANFSVEPGSIFEDQSAQAVMELENRGESTAEDVSFEIFNIPFGEDGWNGTRSRELGQLRPGNPETGLEPVTRQPTVQLTPPEIQRTVTSDVNVAVNYTYNTTASVQMEMISDSRFREERPEQTSPEVDNSAGPVQMDIRTVTPVIFYENDQGRITDTASNFCVVVRNQGTGSVSFEGEDDDVELTWDSTGPAEIVPQEGNSDSVTVDLVNGRATECFEIDFGNNSPDRETQIDVFLTAEYGYEVESSTQVTVQDRAN